tara:strand:+ start:867 stop:1433 length:567 start_codon:yes stop_codon:yes gene_type:complete
MKNNKKNSPLNQDPKFDTTLHDYGRRAHTMTAKERSDYRTGQAHAITFAPTGGALGILGKAAGVIKRNIGGGAHAIGQGLVRKFGTKGMKKTYDTFTNAPKQYLGTGARKSTESITPKGKGYTTDKIQYNPGPAHASRSQDLGLHSVKPNRPNINFARKTDIIGKGELYGNTRAFNRPGMRKTHFGVK